MKNHTVVRIRQQCNHHHTYHHNSTTDTIESNLKNIIYSKEFWRKTIYHNFDKIFKIF